MFYHISVKKLTDKQLMFVPRIPPRDNRLPDENATIPRICVASSIVGCLEAISCTIYKEVVLAEYQETGKVPIYVYAVATEVADCDIITPIELVGKNYVWDAYKTGEHWILKPVKMALSKTIQLSDDMDFVIIERPEDWEEEDEDPENPIFPYVDAEYSHKNYRWKYDEIA